MTVRVAGVDIGGTKTAVLVGDGAWMTAPTPRGPDEIIATVLELIGQASGGAPVVGVGVGSAGTFDDSGSVIAATDHIADWVGTPVAARIAAALAVPVIVINDVHATALGEATEGAGRGVDRVLVVAAGTGLGGAYVRSGTVDTGAHGSAGAVGHLPLSANDRICSCGRIGHAEAYASGPGIERTFREAGGDALGLPAIGRLARAGDEAALAAITRGAAELGRALAVSCAVLDPDLIVVGGGVAQLGDLLLEPVRIAFREHAPALLVDVEIVPAELGVRAATVGARRAIRDHLEDYAQWGHETRRSR